MDHFTWGIIVGGASMFVLLVAFDIVQRRRR